MQWKKIGRETDSPFESFFSSFSSLGILEEVERMSSERWVFDGVIKVWGCDLYGAVRDERNARNTSNADAWTAQQIA